MTNAALTLPRRSEERGFTLTELAIVLGIIGIILGVIWVAAGAVYENNRTARASAQVQQIIGCFKGIYAARRVDIADNTDITAFASTSGCLPADMPLITCGMADLWTGGTTCGAGPWSGSGAYVHSKQTMNGIVVGYVGLSQAACNHLANAVATSNPGLLWAQINSAGTTLPPYGAGSPFIAAYINSDCNQSTGNLVYVMYSMN